MGKGYVSKSTKTINLFVQVDPALDPAGGPWKQWFEWASELLADATDDQLRLGRIVYTVGIADRPDLKLVGRATPSTMGFLGLINDDGGSFMQIGENYLDRPSSLVHELGHYGFNLREEYDGPLAQNPGGIEPKCVDNPATTHVCVMQDKAFRTFELDLNTNPPAPGWGDPAYTEFCTNNHPGTDANYDHGSGGGVTYQDDVHGGDSCWDVMTTLSVDGENPYPFLQVPAGNRPRKPNTAATIPAAVPLTFEEVGSSKGFLLALDRSFSMKLNDAIVGVRYAANVWIDLESMIGNALGVVTYASSGAATVPMGILPQPPTAAHALVEAALVPTGNTNIRDALGDAKSMIENYVAGVNPQPTTAIALFSDGQNTVGPDLKRSDLDDFRGVITVHTVSFGEGADQEAMKMIARETSGTWRHINAPADASNTEYQINFELSELAAHVHSSEIALRQTELGLPDSENPDTELVDEAGSEADLDQIAGLTSEQVFDARHLAELEVLVERGTTRVTFVANSRSDADTFLYVLDPHRNALPPVAPDFRLGDGHAAYTVEVGDNNTGKWRMRMRRLGRGVHGSPRLTPVALYAFAENPSLGVAAFGFGQVHPPATEIEVGAAAYNPGTLTNLDIQVWREGDEGNKIPLRERYAGRGEYIASLVTPDEPGGHTYIIDFRANGGTLPRTRSAAEEAAQELPPREPTGEWRRRKRLTLAVGPLPTGDDDADGGKHDRENLPGCCRALLALIVGLCTRTRRSASRLRAAVDSRHGRELQTGR